MSRACIGVSTLAAQGSSNVSTTARNLQKEAPVFFLQARTSARVYTPKLDLRVGARKPYYAYMYVCMCHVSRACINACCSRF